MKRHVIDTSVVAAAFFSEGGADAARAVLASGDELHAPDLIQAELANVLWKRTRRGEIEPDEAEALLRDFIALPLHITPSDGLVISALSLAIHTGCTVYDCLFLALAVRHGCAMVTADRRLVNALADTPLAANVRRLSGGG